MIKREIDKYVEDLMTWFPVVAITGPRQSGKTTLAKNLFPDFEYINLEDMNLRMQALEDPMNFIQERPSKLIIDEAQLVPELFSAIQVVSDKIGKPGQYVLSGSQNFLLTKNIKQSLAGRCAYVDLYPLSFRELKVDRPDLTIWDFAFSGGYPRIYDAGIPTEIYFDSYIRTYLERDVKDFQDVRDLASYEKMLTISATAASNLLNISNIANSVDVSTKTIKAWLSMLESSYILHQLLPYYSNIKKTLTKTPKLYFNDTGLLCYLLGIKSAKDLKLSEYKGIVIENIVISETIKNYANTGKHPNLFFYRDDSKAEIDLLDFSDRNSRLAYEIKSTGLYQEKFARHLKSRGEILDIAPENQIVLMDTDHSFVSKGTKVQSIEKYLLECNI